jgi:hypothetical protein
MKKLILIVVIMLAPIVHADEFLQMNNGMTCWRNNAGFVYGCSGGVDTGDNGFNDTRTGTRYESVGGDIAVDTRTGQTFNVPIINRDIPKTHKDAQEYDE